MLDQSDWDASPEMKSDPVGAERSLFGGGGPYVSARTEDELSTSGGTGFAHSCFADIDIDLVLLISEIDLNALIMIVGLSMDTNQQAVNIRDTN